jgi:predicted TIM-barrel fold metal-dependent hydrolase
VAEIPFIDTHFHLHDLKHADLRYSWLEWDAVHGFLGNIDAAKPIHYWIEDYIAEIRFSNVPKAIHVQAALGIKDPVQETAWLQAFADRTGYPQGIIAECHLQDADAAEVLERHTAYANVRGIRDFGRGDYLIDPAWQAGFKLLARHNFVSCLDTRFPLFPQVKKLAALAPTTMICIDHCAIPMERTPEYFKAWHAAMIDLGKVENVWMKISGLGMRDPLWTVDSLRPYVLGSIEAFGTDRVVFGTNWPVDRMFSSYPDLINAYAEIIKGFSKDEQRAMFAGNAERLFRI